MNSLWSYTTTAPDFPSMEGDKKTDVLIIGGGIAGVLCAFFLQRAGVNYMLVESNKIGSGITQNTTAKITAQHGLIYHDLIKSHGTEYAKKYLDINLLALDIYEKLSHNIDFDFEKKDTYVYSLNKRQALEDEMLALEKLGFPCELQQDLPLPFTTKGAVKYANQAQFHPLRFLFELAKNLNIYENTRVTKLENNVATIEKGKITANKVIVATHFPFMNKHGSYFLKLYQHRSYVMALENAPNIDGMYVDEAMKGMSFRNYNDLLFVGGGDHRTGKKGGNWNELEQFAFKYYPQAREKFRWAAQDCMSLDNVPYIGQYSKHTPNLYVCTGFNKWGMTSAMASAMIVSDLVLERENPFAEVFSPSRSMMKPQLLLNFAEASANLLTPSGKRCPHMGCALKWNPTERTWDCACHGSRFSLSGTVIDNPANGNLRK